VLVLVRSRSRAEIDEIRMVLVEKTAVPVMASSDNTEMPPDATPAIA
jgi:hypothetical protein